MDRLREMEVFVGIAEAGSFAGAGRRLNMSPPAVTRAVAALEDRLGARLLSRTTRSLSLTETGQRFLETARRVLAELDHAEREITGEATTPSGHLTMTASVTFGRMALAPIVCDFLAAHPRITVSLVLLDRVVSLVEEGIDVGFRIGDLPDSTIIARRVGEVRRVLVASPGYLAKRGEPQRPSDLSAHSFIGFRGLMSSRGVPLTAGDKPLNIPVRPRLDVNDAATALMAAEAGHGIANLYCYVAGESIRAGRLTPVLAAHWPACAPVHIVYPDARLLASKVRALVDWAAPRLTSELHRLSAQSDHP
ncbi:MAG: LysR family transcriptional regulator [Hyphomicrobiaceae bacterium]|nr:LysR family transcriptional regulator [Hyphomicrobiaceae bacterium]